MYSQIISHTGTGTAAAYDLSFDAAAVWVIPGSAEHIAFHTPTMWCARSNAWGAMDSISDGVRILGRRILIGPDDSCNAAGVNYQILVIGSESSDIETPSWCGNAQTGRTVALMRSAEPVFVAVKRDSARPAVVAVAGSAVAAMDGTTVADSIALGSGVLTLTSAPEVNEWNPATELGEGHDAIVLHSDSGAVVGSYTGTGAAGAISVGCDAAAVFCWRPGSAEVCRVFVRGAQGGVAKSADAVAPVAAGSLYGGRLSFSGATANNSGGGYRFLAIPLRTPRAATPLAPAAIVRNKRALQLAGRGVVGYVDCGTGLNIDGAITLEWLGEVPGDAQSGALFDGWLLGKAATAQSVTSGGASWGISSVSRIDGGHGWAGPQATAVCNRRVFYGTPLDTASWRTGIIVPAGVHMHTYIHRGGGESEYWIDGVRVKQRKISTDSIVSSAAHRVTMGARWTGSAYSNNSRMLILGARVYNRALTADEVQARHAIARLGAATAEDVSSGVLAAWDGSGLAGAVWADSAGSNVGAITNGAIVIL